MLKPASVFGLLTGQPHTYTRRGCAEFDPRYEGVECYSSEYDEQSRWTFNAKGEVMEPSLLRPYPKELVVGC